MSVQPIERVDIELIEALDFEFAPQCESEGHGVEVEVHAGPATVLLKMVMDCCGFTVVGYRCEPFMHYALTVGRFYCDCPDRFGHARVTVLGRVGRSS